MLSNGYELILASKSPRRAQLLQQAGIKFTFGDIDVAEDYPEDLPTREVAPFLARKKANGAGHLLQNDRQIVLTADSVVILDGVIYEKPRDREDALRILQQLSGREHTVITGLCLRSRRHEVLTYGESRVHFLPLSRAEIEYYIDTWSPYDKAGAYAIQEWIGLCKIDRIEGTYSNIMGLPMDKVYSALREFGPVAV